MSSDNPNGITEYRGWTIFREGLWFIAQKRTKGGEIPQLEAATSAGIIKKIQQASPLPGKEASPTEPHR